MSKDKRQESEHPDPEVRIEDERRQFSAQEKLDILKEADACERGEVGSVLRKHGIYWSYLSRWRQARDRGELEGLTAKKRGRKRSESWELEEKNSALQQENARLRERLEQATMVIDVQKKLCELLGLETPPRESIEQE